MQPRIRVALLYGGRSAEHEVSQVSAVAVLNALDPERYEVIPIGITPAGGWRLTSPDALGYDEGSELRRALEVRGMPVTLTGDPSVGSLVPLHGDASALAAVTQVDVVFPLLHGPFGEDGTVQGLCELADIAYVGSGVAGSALAMDKVLSKRALRGAGLAVADFIEVREARWLASPADVVAEVAEQLGWPCFVKPSNLGSSVGVSKVHEQPELAGAIEGALSYDPVVIVEEAIAGRELEVAVLGDDDPEATLPGEIIPGREFYDYEDKYLEEGAKLLVPAPLEPEVAEAARALALSAYAALGLEGMARVDLFLRDDGTLLVNEANTIPGFTPISMYPKLWEASGVSYRELCDRLIQLALSRHARRARRGQLRHR